MLQKLPLELDRFDRIILREVQRNVRITAAELAGLVGLSPSACHRRLSALRDSGAIEAEIAIVSPHAVGQHLTLVVTVALKVSRPEVVAAFKAACRAEARISQCYHVTGPDDFLLVLTAPTIEDYDAFVQRFLTTSPDVRRFQAMVVMDRVKVGFGLPIDEP